MKKVSFMVLAFLGFAVPVLAQGVDSTAVPVEVTKLGEVLGVGLVELAGIGALITVLLEAGKRLLNLQGKVTLIASGALSVGYGFLQYHSSIPQLAFASICTFAFATGLWQLFGRFLSGKTPTTTTETVEVTKGGHGKNK